MSDAMISSINIIVSMGRGERWAFAVQEST